MSKFQISLSSLLLKEHFGDVVERVGVYLIKKGLTPFKVIVQETAVSPEKVKESLCALLQHNMAQFEVHTRGHVEYSVDPDVVCVWFRIPYYIYCAKLLFGDAAELLIEELLQHGKMSKQQLVTRVTPRLRDALSANGSDIVVSESEIHSRFVDLVQTHFIQRSSQPTKPDATSGNVKKVPVLTLKEEDMFTVPDESKKRKRSSEANTSQSSKRRRISSSSEDEKGTDDDENILWQVNVDRFHRHMRDRAIVNTVTRRLDKKAGEVIRTILRLSEVQTNPTAAVTTPLSSNEIFQGLPKEMNFSKDLLDRYLTLLADDSMEMVFKAGESGGGLYSVHLVKAVTCLCRAHVESVVQERFGSKCLRIYRILQQKRQMEQKQIEESAMIPAKEAKELLYHMFGEGFLSLTEVPKVPDHAPSRTFYLFSVDLPQVVRMLLQRSYKTASNLISRRGYEVRENKRLLDKAQRVEAIAASLEQSGADEAQREEIEQMITPPEKQQLKKVKHITTKLEQSELQLDETMFVFRTYLQHIKLK